MATDKKIAKAQSIITESEQYRLRKKQASEEQKRISVCKAEELASQKNEKLLAEALIAKKWWEERRKEEARVKAK